jgi:hypothetical protein
VPWPLFVQGNANAGLPKALGKAQAGDPASNNSQVKSHGRSMARFNGLPAMGPITIELAA